MRGHRDEQQVRELRRQDGSARRHRVGGRTGGRSHDNAVGLVGGEVLLIDVGRQPHGARHAAPADHDVVQRVVTLDPLSAAPALRRQHHAALQPVVALQHGGSLLSHSVGVNSDKKPSRPRLMPRMGVPDLNAMRAARRIVPSPPSVISRPTWAIHCRSSVSQADAMWTPNPQLRSRSAIFWHKSCESTNLGCCSKPIDLMSHNAVRRLKWALGTGLADRHGRLRRPSLGLSTMSSLSSCVGQ